MTGVRGDGFFHIGIVPKEIPTVKAADGKDRENVLRFYARRVAAKEGGFLVFGRFAKNASDRHYVVLKVVFRSDADLHQTGVRQCADQGIKVDAKLIDKLPLDATVAAATVKPEPPVVKEFDRVVEKQRRLKFKRA